LFDLLPVILDFDQLRLSDLKPVCIVRRLAVVIDSEATGEIFASPNPSATKVLEVGLQTTI